MKKLMAFCLLMALALPVAAVEDDQVMYIGGTTPALRAGTVGRLDTTSETSLTFEHSGGAKLLISYADIQSFEYSTEVTRHLGVLPAIGVGLVKMRRHRHYFRISYRGADSVSQVAVFEVPKNTCHPRCRPSSRLALLTAAGHAHFAPARNEGGVPCSPQAVTIQKVSQAAKFLPLAGARLRS